MDARRPFSFRIFIIIPKRTGEVNSQSASLPSFRRLAAMKAGINGATAFGKAQDGTRAGLPKKSCRPVIRPREAFALFRRSQSGGEAALQRSSRMRPLPFRPHPGFPSPAAAQRRRGQRRLGVSSIRDYQHPPPLCGGGDRDGSAVFSSLKKIFSFFSRTIDFCAAQGFILFSAEKCGASPNETRASAALYAGCKYKAFARPFCGARKGRKHKKSHLPLGVLPLAERTNAGNSRSE